jgi:protein phosphatase 2C family protein 2/3
MKTKIILSLLSVFCSFSVIATQLQLNFGIASHQNKRPYQEDRFTHVEIGEGHFFGMYDGHDGADVASFLQQNLHNYLFGPFFTLKEACEKVFFKAEQHALKHFTDGSTALMVFVDHNNIMHCAWAGDTKMVLEKNGAVTFETTDHKPNNPHELARIEKNGGYIEKFGVYRVGGLAVARSIGDAQLKHMYQGQIIAMPDYKKIALDETHHYMVMATDGLWDVMSSEEAVNVVHAMFQRCRNLDFIAEHLQNEAIKRGSSDNITVCVVCFAWE